MANIAELTAQIVSSQAAGTQMSTDDIILAISRVSAALKAVESGQSVEATTATEAAPVEEVKPTLTLKQAFKKDEVICMICGKGGMKTLKRHLATTHEMKPGEYRKKFKIPASQSLVAKAYSESRRQSAVSRNLGDNLAKARATRAANAADKAKVAVPEAEKVVKAPKVAALKATKAPAKVAAPKVAATKAPAAPKVEKAPAKAAAPAKVAPAAKPAKAPATPKATATQKKEVPLKTKAAAAPKAPKAAKPAAIPAETQK